MPSFPYNSIEKEAPKFGLVRFFFQSKKRNKCLNGPFRRNEQNEKNNFGVKIK